MSSSKKTMKLFITAMVAALAFSALVAAAASASTLPAKFSSPWIQLTTTSVTIKRGGLEPKTCTISGLEITAEGSNFVGGNREGGETLFSCGSLASLQMRFAGSVSYDTETAKYTFYDWDFTAFSLRSPFSEEYWQNTGGKIKATWTNGSGSTPSTITFNETPIGKTVTKSSQLTMTGTFQATNLLTGGLVTLSH